MFVLTCKAITCCPVLGVSNALKFQRVCCLRLCAFCLNKSMLLPPTNLLTTLFAAHCSSRREEATAKIQCKKESGRSNWEPRELISKVSLESKEFPDASIGFLKIALHCIKQKLSSAIPDTTL